MKIHTFCFTMCISTFLVCLTSSAVEAPDGWTPDVMISYNRVGATAVSPGGDLVAYTLSIPRTDGEHSDYRTHICIVSGDGSFSRRYTSVEHSCYNPAFSPDGRYLSFTTSRGEDGKTQVWAMPVDGGEAEQVTGAETGVRSYAWSPDGSRIAYIMRDPGTDDEATNRREKRDMTVRDTNEKYNHIHTVTFEKNAEGNRSTKRLTAGDFHVTAFDWSPDCENIVFAHQTNPSPDVWSTTDISSVPADSGAVTLLVTSPGADRYPRYSPDGKWIAFPSDMDDPHWALLSDMYVIPAEGGQPRKLAETPDRNFMYYGRIIGWSAYSSELYVREANGTSWRVFGIPLDGGKSRMVTPGPGNFSGVSLSAEGGSMAFVHQAPEIPPDVYLTGTATFKPRKLTEVNAGHPNLPMGKTEVISWKSRDGLEIEGLLTYPVAYVTGRRCPLILFIHGGPANLHTQAFTAAANKYPIQAFAQRGYAVLRANPRGSSGYGKEFRYANINDWGFGDFDDQMSGVDKVIEMGVAHPDSLCVTGWSYGGYMTSMTVTKTDRFKAAVMGAGISNLVSFTGTADIPSFIPDYFRGEPWERTETYIRHSAVFHAENVTTPTLILHGALDRRVPLSQGEEFYNALRRKGCETELVVYPRSYHSPGEPKFVADIGNRIIEWFDRHLGR